MPTEGTFDVRHTTEDVVQASPPIPLPPLPEFPLTPEGVMGTLARLRRNSSVTISLNRDGTPSVQIFNLPVPLDPRSEALGIPLTHETAAISKNTSFKEENKSAIIRDNVAMSEDAGFHSKVDRFANASYRDEDFIAEGHQTNEDRYVNSNGEEKKADDEESDEEDYWAIDKQEDEFKNVGTVERIQNIIFSVLFSMAHGNNAGALLEYGSDIIEDLQLTAFLLAPEFMVAYWLPSWLVAASNADYQNMELGQYEIYFFLATASVILLVINMIFVAGGIMRGKQVSMLPIKLLRFLATVLPTVLYIPIFEILVSVLTCNQVIPRGPDDAITLQNTSCSDPMRWPLVVTSTVALLVYVPTGVSLAAVFFDTNPTLKSVSNRVHGRADIIYLVMKTGVILAFRFLDPALYFLKCIIVLAVSITMYCVVLYYFPFYNPIINQIRAGFFASTAGVGIVSLVACITYSVTGNTQGEYVMIVMISALILFFGVGFWFAGYVLTRIQARARAYLDEYRDPKNPRRMLIPMPTNAKEPIVFLLWPHVEIAARFITRNMDERSRAFNKNQIPDMVCLFTQGLKEFPKHPIVRICYGNYYFLLTGEKEIPSKQYAILAKSKVPYDVAFQIYFNRQIVNQTTDKKVLGLGSILNLANFAEMQKTEMDAKVHHYLSVQETRTMWKLLLNKNFRMEELLNVTARVYTYSHLAHENYLKLIFKHPKSSLYVRYYARFCYDVTGDAAKAKELSDKADLLDERRTGTLRESELHKKEITRSIASSIGQSTYGRIAAIVIQKKRLKHVVKLGGILRIVIGITIGIIISIAIVTYIIVSSLLTDLNAFSGNLVRLHAIEFMIAMESRRLRQIQNAHNVNDSLYFDDRRSLMFLEMQNFSSVSEAFFLNRDQTSASIESWFIDTKIQTINSHFPASSNKTSLNLTFHDYTEQFVICGLSIANTSFPGFTNSSYRDDVRFLLDNSLTAIAQVIDPLFQTALIPSLNNKTKEAILKIYALTCCEIFIICLGLTLKDITSFYLTKSQKQSLKILREVPKYAVQNLLDDLEDADSDGLFSEQVIQSSDQYKTRITPIMSIIIYHLQSKFFCFCAISLAVVMACINLKNIFLVGQNFGIYNAAGDIATSTIRVYNRAYEILHFDPLTDISKETLVDQLIARTSLLENSLYRVQYGDVNFNPSTPSYDTFPMDLYYPLMLEKCLPYNKSQCLAENRHFNESIGYTGVLLDSGLMKMTHAYTNFAIDLSSSGTFGPSGASKVSLMDKLLEPDLVQGWLTFENAVLVSTNKLVSATNISTMIIFILQVVFLNIAFMAQQMYLTWRESRFR